MGKQKINKRLFMDNSGASLVLVLVAMFFVGVIASIVLTITVGNSKATRTSQDSSQNFYSTESALDDLKLYLNKLATTAATEAYARTITDSGNVADPFDPTRMLTDDEIFKLRFKEYLEETLTTMFNDPDITEGFQFKDDFLRQYVTYGRSGDIKITFGSFETNSEGYLVLKDVKVSLTGNEETLMTAGYENTITTDITFKAEKPGLGKLNTSGEFKYPIYRYVVISGEDIVPANNEMLDNKLVGGIYAYGYFNVASTDSVSDASLEINSQSMIIGKDINIKNGEVDFGPISDYPEVLMVGENPDTNVWCDNLKVGDATVNWNMIGRLTDNIYLRKNLVLNGNNARFTGNGGNIVGYSSMANVENNIAIRESSTEPLSSAIILNGLGATLDIDGLNKLHLAGQAYTAMSSIEGIYDTYKDVPTTASDLLGTSAYTMSYFTQGESITYRPIQALYLIPGDCIPGVGHNPMTATEFASFEPDGEGSGTINAQAVPNISGYLDSPSYKSMTVRYVSGSNTNIENNVYLFWNFKNTDSAVAYFNSITGKTGSKENRYDGLLKKQAEMLSRNGGEILLPENTATDIKCNIIGNGIKNGTSKVAGRTTTAFDASAVEDCSDTRNALISSLNQAGGDGTHSLVENMFSWNSSGLVGTKANTSSPEDGYDLRGPLETQDTSEFIDVRYLPADYVSAVEAEHPGKTVAKAKITYSESSSWTYKLITGPNVELTNFDSNTKYVVITPGDVTMPEEGVGGTEFNGIIIAGGNVTIPQNLTMKCMGVIEQSPTYMFYDAAGTLIATKSDAPTQVVEEFRALLDTVVNNDDANNANTTLRSIFNIAYNGSESSNTTGRDYVTLELSGWSRE